TVLAAPVAQEPEVSLAATRENVRVVTNPGPEFFPAAREVVARARARNATTAGYFLYGYAAVQVVAAAASATNDPSRSSLAAAPRARAVPTVMGDLQFTASGDLAGWRFAVLAKAGGGIAAVDVCKAPDCKDYEQCPRDCPK